MRPARREDRRRLVRRDRPARTPGRTAQGSTPVRISIRATHREWRAHTHLFVMTGRIGGTRSSASRSPPVRPTSPSSVSASSPVSSSTGSTCTSGARSSGSARTRRRLWRSSPPPPARADRKALSVGGVDRRHAYLNGERSTSIGEWARVVKAACAAAAVRHRRSRSGPSRGVADRRGCRDDHLHRRHYQAAAGPADLRLDRRGHERQPPAAAVRVGDTKRSCPPGRSRRARSRRGSSGSTANPVTSSSPTPVSPLRFRSAIFWRRR